MNRREFMKATAIGAVAVAVPSIVKPTVAGVFPKIVSSFYSSLDCVYPTRMPDLDKLLLGGFHPGIVAVTGSAASKLMFQLRWRVSNLQQVITNCGSTNVIHLISQDRDWNGATWNVGRLLERYNLEYSTGVPQRYKLFANYLRKLYGYIRKNNICMVIACEGYKPFEASNAAW